MMSFCLDNIRNVRKHEMVNKVNESCEDLLIKITFLILKIFVVLGYGNVVSILLRVSSLFDFLKQILVGDREQRHQPCQISVMEVFAKIGNSFQLNLRYLTWS